MSRENDNGFEEWGGYMGAKITKLEEQFTAASDPFRKSNLFAGISIFVNGHTNPSADELKRIMMVHGGIFHHYERSHTTYIIASNLPDVKVRKMNTSKYISAQWVVDCLKEKRILDYTRYLLYTNQKPTQPRISFIKSKKEQTDEEQAKPPNKEHVAAILRDLEQLKAKMRESLPATAADVSNEEVEHKFQPPVPAETSLQPKKPINLSTTSSSVARTAVDPKFLSEFYSNSRLHHIATLGAGFKQYVGELREKHDAAKGFPALTQLKEKLCSQGVPQLRREWGPCVMHIDMDCFFVSVGLRTHPHLRGQPVAVTHSKGGTSASEVPVHPSADRKVEMELFAKRFEQHQHNNVLSDKVRNGFDSKMSLSEIASCSYEARAKGLRNGMFVGQAIKMCPELQTIPYDFEGYREVASTLYDTIAQYTLNIEAVSCDEMFVDLKDALAALEVGPMDFVQAIREEVRQKTGCPCSAGVGANKLQARMATKQAKPDGQYHLATDVESYMNDIPIQELPGVGSSTAYTLKEAQLLTCGDLQKVSLAKIQMLVGKKLGETLNRFCRGIDNRPLAYGQIRKSVSAEVNYGIRFAENSELETFLRQLSTEVHTRLTDIKRRTKCVTLRLMVRAKEAPVETSKFMGHGVCDNVTKSVSLSEFTNDLEVITRCILTTMKALALPPHELRGIGIQLSKLDDPSEGKEKKENAIKNMFNKVVEKQKEKQTAELPPPSRDASAIKTTKKATPSNESQESSPLEPVNKKSLGVITKESTKRPPNVMGMMQDAAAKRAAITNIDPSTIDLPADVDPEVFAALPADIRAEILRDRARQLLKTGQSSTNSNQNALNESDFLPSTSRAAQEKLLSKEKIKSEIPPPQLPPPLQVDPDFLEALPPELRTEIELQIINQQRPIYRAISPPADLPLNCNKRTKFAEPIKEIAADNIFMQKDCKQFLLAWLKSGDCPQDYDVELITGHGKEIVRAMEFEMLFEPLVYLCRLINSQKSSSADCSWHLAYRSIVAAIQVEMGEVYAGRKLFLSDTLLCDKCTLES